MFVDLKSLVGAICKKTTGHFLILLWVVVAAAASTVMEKMQPSLVTEWRRGSGYFQGGEGGMYA